MSLNLIQKKSCSCSWFTSNLHLTWQPHLELRSARHLGLWPGPVYKSSFSGDKVVSVPWTGAYTWSDRIMQLFNFSIISLSRIYPDRIKNYHETEKNRFILLYSSTIIAKLYNVMCSLIRHVFQELCFRDMDKIHVKVCKFSATPSTRDPWHQLLHNNRGMTHTCMNYVIWQQNP